MDIVIRVVISDIMKKTGLNAIVNHKDLAKQGGVPELKPDIELKHTPESVDRIKEMQSSIKKMESKKLTKLDISKFSNGIYLIQLTQGQNIFSSLALQAGDSLLQAAHTFPVRAGSCDLKGG